MNKIDNLIVELNPIINKHFQGRKFTVEEVDAFFNLIEDLTHIFIPGARESLHSLPKDVKMQYMKRYSQLLGTK